MILIPGGLAANEQLVARKRTSRSDGVVAMIIWGMTVRRG